MMKKILTLFAALALISTKIFSQATPNPSFDNWTHNSFPSYDSPDNWDNLNAATGTLGVFTCIKATAAADVHSGAAAVKLITKSVFGQTANGIVTTGTINTITQTIAGGIPYTLRPDSIVGWYKYTAVNGDNGFTEILLLGSGGISDTIGHARFLTPTTTVTAWTRFALAINYFNSNPVIKSIWILSSSKDAVVHNIGSTAYFDDVDLVFVLPTTITEKIPTEMVVSPNPAAGFLNIANASNATALFVMCDMAGRKVMQKRIENTSTVDIQSLPSGLYVYKILDANSTVIKADKIIIQ